VSRQVGRFYETPTLLATLWEQRFRCRPAIVFCEIMETHRAGRAPLRHWFERGAISVKQAHEFMRSGLPRIYCPHPVSGLELWLSREDLSKVLVRLDEYFEAGGQPHPPTPKTRRRLARAA